MRRDNTRHRAEVSLARSARWREGRTHGQDVSSFVVLVGPVRAPHRARPREPPDERHLPPPDILEQARDDRNLVSCAQPVLVPPFPRLLVPFVVLGACLPLPFALLALALDLNLPTGRREELLLQLCVRADDNRVSNAKFYSRVVSARAVRARERAVVCVVRDARGARGALRRSRGG